MPKLNLSDAFLRTLKPSAELDGIEYWDEGCSGLFLRVNKTSLTWKFQYRALGSTKKRKADLGAYPDVRLSKAREGADALRVKVQGGGDPNGEREQAKQERRDAETPALTFRELVDLYITDATKNGKKSAERDERGHLDRDAIPLWGDRDPASITKREIAAQILKVAERAPIGANRVRASLMAVFKYAEEKMLIETSPVLGVRKPTKETPGEVDRVMTDAELVFMLKAIEASDLAAGVKGAFRMLAYTGMRPAEACGLALEELRHLDKPEEAIAEFPSGRMKAGRKHIAPLTKTVISLIEGEIAAQVEQGQDDPLQEDTPITHVFASRFKGREQVASASLPQAMRRLIEGMEPKGADAAIIKGLQADRPTPHSFRRTVVTGLSKLGVSLEDRQAVVGHMPQGVTKRHYDAYARQKEKLIALTKWETHVNDLLSGKINDGRVVAFRRKAT